MVADRPPLRVDAELDASVDGHPLAVSGEGDQLTVAVSSLAEGLAIAREAGDPEQLRSLATLAGAAGLTADVTVHDRVVARAGRDAAPGTLGRRFGVELRPDGILGAAVAGLHDTLS